MKQFEIVAHRGIPAEAPENTIASFQRAIELGADAVELDIRLTSDQIPVAYHYFYLQENTSAAGVIFNFTLEQIRNIEVFCSSNPAAKTGSISTLSEILAIFDGKIGLEIEIKGPEPEAPEIIGNVLNKFKNIWNTVEVTSYEPALLLAIQKNMPWSYSRFTVSPLRKLDEVRCSATSGNSLFSSFSCQSSSFAPNSIVGNSCHNIAPARY